MADSEHAALIADARAHMTKADEKSGYFIDMLADALAATARPQVSDEEIIEAMDAPVVISMGIDIDGRPSFIDVYRAGRVRALFSTPPPEKPASLWARKMACKCNDPWVSIAFDALAATARPQVTDEMVERAAKAYADFDWQPADDDLMYFAASGNGPMVPYRVMRAALEAALSEDA